MNKFLIPLLLALAATMPVMAQTTTAPEEPATTEKAAGAEDHGMGFWVETRTTKKGPAELTIYWDRYLTDSVGVYAQTIKDSTGYASAYAGPKFKLAEGVDVGIGIGREVLTRHASSTTVKNAWVSVDQEKYSLYVTVEKGAAGTWHKAIALYKLTDSVNVGAMNETGLGTGPRVEWSFAKNAQAWLAILGGKPAIAINYAF